MRTSTITSLLLTSSLMIGGCSITAPIEQSASTVVTAADYQRAKSRLKAATKKLVLGTVDNPKWLSSNRLSYRTQIESGHQFMIANLDTQSKQPAFDHLAIANALSSQDNDYQQDNLPFKSYKFNPKFSEINFKIAKQNYRCNLTSYQCNKLDKSPEFKHQVISPDGKQAAFIRDFNLWLRDTTTQSELQLTTDGIEHLGYATNNAGWTRSKTPVLLWSPDSSKIATFIHDSRLVKNMHLVSTNVGHPKLDSWKYPLPGDEHIFTIERLVIDINTKQITKLKLKPDPQRSTITDHIYSRGKWLDVQWSDDNQSLAFASVSRDHQQATLRIADVATGQVTTILDEKVATFFESGNGKVNWQYLPQSNEIIWFSQRSDWGHLYLYNLATGQLKHQITEGNWNVLQLLKVDQQSRQLYFTGAGREGTDPYFEYFYRINFDGSGLKLLTSEIANHQILLNQQQSHFVDRFSTPITPEVSKIMTINGDKILALEQSDISPLLATGWVAPIPFVVKDRNNKFDIHGLMYQPSNFDPRKSYPIINYLYPGPQSGSIGSRSFVASRGDKQAMAELGFILIEIDALGTPMRSKSFHAFYYGNMGDSGVPDQMAAIKQLAAKHSYLDLNRVGIWGHSGGGFASTNAILKYPDFYKVAVSGAGNHDNRNYADPWGEKWQGLLNTNEDKSTNYDNQANQLIVEGLKGKLLLAHGTSDDNVPPYNTLLVVDALIKANKDFDLLLLPNRRHGFAREPYMMRKRCDYFVDHLMVTPHPKEFNLGK